jgi:hypothetical protein
VFEFQIVRGRSLRPDAIVLGPLATRTRAARGAPFGSRALRRRAARAAFRSQLARAIECVATQMTQARVFLENGLLNDSTGAAIDRSRRTGPLNKWPTNGSGTPDRIPLASATVGWRGTACCTGHNRDSRAPNKWSVERGMWQGKLRTASMDSSDRGNRRANSQWPGERRRGCPGNSRPSRLTFAIAAGVANRPSPSAWGHFGYWPTHCSCYRECG